MVEEKPWSKMSRALAAHDITHSHEPGHVEIEVYEENATKIFLMAVQRRFLPRGLVVVRNTPLFAIRALAKQIAEGKLAVSAETARGKTTVIHVREKPT